MGRLKGSRKGPAPPPRVRLASLHAMLPQHRSHTAVVMMDTRPAQLPADAPAAELDYPQLAVELNRGYACQHGYDPLVQTKPIP